MDPNAVQDYARQYCVMLARLKIALREYTGLTPQEVAERAGLSLSTVRTHEAAGRRARLEDHLLICDALGFDFFSIGYEVHRRMQAASVKLPSSAKESPAAFVRRRCECGDRITPAEVRRQLRIMAGLTLPAEPAPARKRAPAKKRKPGKATRGSRASRR